MDKKVIEIMANYLGLKEEEITSDMDLMAGRADLDDPRVDELWAE